MCFMWRRTSTRTTVYVRRRMVVNWPAQMAPNHLRTISAIRWHRSPYHRHHHLHHNHINHRHHHSYTAAPPRTWISRTYPSTTAPRRPNRPSPTTPHPSYRKTIRKRWRLKSATQPRRSCRCLTSNNTRRKTLPPCKAAASPGRRPNSRRRCPTIPTIRATAWCTPTTRSRRTVTCTTAATMTRPRCRHPRSPTVTPPRTCRMGWESAVPTITADVRTTTTRATRVCARTRIRAPASPTRRRTAATSNVSGRGWIHRRPPPTHPSPIRHTASRTIRRIARIITTITTTVAGATASTGTITTRTVRTTTIRARRPNITHTAPPSPTRGRRRTRALGRTTGRRLTSVIRPSMRYTIY